MELHIPHFIYSAPTVAHGGGAEVLPATLSSLYEVEEQLPTEGAAPFEFSSTDVSFPVSAPAPKPDLSLFTGLSFYSASGFDLLSILSRVASRPNPRVVLGPVDLTCSFVVVDLRRYDHPIVYCSPSFCTLTGYSEAEVIGRNCRFLQAPGGQVCKGEIRRFTSHDAVTHLAKSLMADKECQTSILNYKKNGDAFMNLLTVIPVPGGVAGGVDEHGEVAFQVGFQVDLSQQPNAILEKLRDGSYIVDYAHPPTCSPQQQQLSRPVVSREKKANTIPPIMVSKELKRLLVDPPFLRSLPITASTTLQSSSPVSAIDDPSMTQLLHLVLLEASPDFIHVVSLKGTFLYVAPSVRRVLGYEPDEMVGTSIADYAHPEDVVPLMRELKESSATGLTSASDPTPSYSASSSPPSGSPRSVDLLFRAKTKMGRYVWVECRGRLHVEPGKGRKAIILSGRAREMMNLKWEDVDSAGGLAMAIRVPSTMKAKVEDEGAETEKGRWCYQDQEFWGILGGTDKDSARFLSVGKAVRDVLGWSGEELLGKGLAGIVEQPSQDALGEGVEELRRYQRAYYTRSGGGSYDSPRVRKVRCQLSTKCGSGVDVWFILYRADPDLRGQIGCAHETGGKGVSPAALVYQIRRVDARVMKCGPGMADVLGTSSSSVLPLDQDIFQELHISRNSSWQYELQQLRFANVRLEEELKILEAAEEVAEAEAILASVVGDGERYVEMGAMQYQEQQSSLASSIQHQDQYPRQQDSIQYSLPMPPPPLPLPVLAPQPQVQIHTPDNLLDQQYNLKYRQPNFQMLDDQALPVRTSVRRSISRSVPTRTTHLPPQLYPLEYSTQTRTDWPTTPLAPYTSPFPSLAFVHHHQHQHQHQHHQHHHHSSGQQQGQGQGYGLKRSWNTMDSA